MTEKDHKLSLDEVCQKLGKSRKTIARYIKSGLLHPESVKSERGTLEYRFTEADIKTFQMGQMRQDRQDRRDTTDGTKHKTKLKEKPDKPLADEDSREDKTGQTGHVSENKLIDSLLKQLEEKDKQIGKKDEQLERKDTQIERRDTQITNLINNNKQLFQIADGLRTQLLLTGQKAEGIPEHLDPEKRNRRDRKDGIIELGPDEVTTGHYSKTTLKTETKKPVEPPPFSPEVNREDEDERKKETVYEIAIKTINDPFGTAKNVLSNWWKGKR